MRRGCEPKYFLKHIMTEAPKFIKKWRNKNYVVPCLFLKFCFAGMESKISCNTGFFKMMSVLVNLSLKWKIS